MGRTSELSVLWECLRPDGPVVCFAHGIPGIGKTDLLKAFEALALLATAAVTPFA